MSIFSVQARKHTAYYDNLLSTSTSRTPCRERKIADTTLGKSVTASGESVCEDSRSSDKSRPVNRTYVVSALSKSGSGQQTPYRARLTLQRRSRRKTGAETAEQTMTDSSQSTTAAPEKRLTLQRRTRTPSMDKSGRGQPGGLQSTPKVLGEPNGRTPGIFRSMSLRETATHVQTQGRFAQNKTSSSSSSSSRNTDDTHTFKTPTRKTPFERIAAKRDVFERLAGKEAPKPVLVKSASLERPKPRAQQAENTKPFPAPRISKTTSGVRRPDTTLQVIKTKTSNQKRDVTQVRTSDPAPPEQILPSTSEGLKQQDLLKMENSAVTVAVRVRPFSAREKAEKSSQVIFMNGQETVVQHPESRQSYSFTYDFSFCSVDASDSNFACQQTVYETLAKPLVREHPVHGPYVAELSANVVRSYNDVQGWLELGNKQRATAATGMNDKSSRSHSVFTLVMTQTKTELVEGEEHDHSITSRINLIDLAGSERCHSAQTSGDRLREGASINKSLLTLGKVISALSEQALTKKKVFIPYRDSVLTWLLKESLGGNSKTAMIATLSPAGSNVEESLSTLRYAQQARTIINVAKVNEDTNAKLIRDLKAEVEKLRAAQMSSQGVEPERVRLFQQEISTLRNKLCQQEREMIEANRAWREKLEQAEIRKREETKELQKAGVTFKVDNRLPNLVNLNEDPQLSEMLLYMIKEGRTTVGKLKSNSSHDIQLTGALIADQHCVISNIHDTVSIIPMENAKTFVNGNLISESTVLHHGDRVILGGDHYFRFNHPAEVQSGKRASCWTGEGDGHKDFEFAKNELLAAQRALLEAEIEEAHLKAKQEMMQGIQMAKEVAQKELSDQKVLYEEKIRALERELNEENERKRQQDLEQQRVASQMAELKTAKLELEQEVDVQRKRLRIHMETQAMEEHRVRQARIVEALEAEKKKIGKELEEIQKKRALRENHTPQHVSPQWDAMKLSLMIEEANKISAKLKKHTVFSRHESSENEKCGGVLQVRVQNTKLGIATFWCLEKFQNNIAAMRELERGDSSSKDDNVFYDPDDEWEQDISASSSSAASFSRRRSRSLLKSRRISGRLYEIRVHPIQSLHSGSSQSAGLMGVTKSPSLHSSISDPGMPGICKELVDFGCESEITSMVKEARRKTSQCLDTTLLALGHMAVVTGMSLNVTGLGAQAMGKPSVVTCLMKGTGKGVRSLLEESLTITREMLREAQLSYPRSSVLQSLKSKTLDLARALESYMYCHISERESEPQVEEGEEDALASLLQKLRTTSTKLFQLNQAIRQLHSSLSTALRGKDFKSCRDTISSSAKAVDELITGLSKDGIGAPTLQLPCLQTVMSARDELHSILESLSSLWNQQEEGESRSSASFEKDTEEESSAKERAATHSTVRHRVVSKIVYALAPGVQSNSGPHWV
ncbi:kinesin-like protein KIF14 [Neolamprologus brichardi]|uniref:kinesin-like protein KIF14 n=1 Tax=Neolamprologus brichardi TaxID=32507 RepID=UPI0003EBBDDF|nr:kinesin-like protein KIF14 [Neolamprologus brichardi]